MNKNSNYKKPSKHFWRSVTQLPEDWKSVCITAAKIQKENILRFVWKLNLDQKQPFRGVLKKSCSENMQQIYRRTPMPKWDFNKAALRLGCSHVNLLHISRTPFLKNTSGWLFLLDFCAINYIWKILRKCRKGSKYAIFFLRRFRLVECPC